ncbi:metal-sensing transcriptional repressor [Acetoanaerobium noterae]|nr:metal-sensing transcriptional repressor [Acetoanaerobium noterae]
MNFAAKLELLIRQHMNHCVKEAFTNDSGEEKIDEFMHLLEKIINK